MDELVNTVAQRTGLSQEQARAAAQATIDFLKSRMPPQLAGQVDNALKGGGGNMGDIAKGLGGMMGQQH